MTQARYNSSDNTLKEISQMEKPKRPFAGNYSPQESPEFRSDLYHYECNLKIYNDHIASLRTVPCHDSCRGLWKEGDVLEEGKDYKIYEYADRPVLAYPVMDESEDLWDDVVTIVAGSWSREKIIAELKEKYTITRKQ